MSLTNQRRGFTKIELLVVIGILGILLGLIVKAVQFARDAGLRSSCLNNMRQLGQALHQYHDVHNNLPPGVAHPRLSPNSSRNYFGPDTDPFPLLNWQARLLPYVEQEELWKITVQAYAEDSYFFNNPPHVGITYPISLFLCPVDRPRILPNKSPETTPAVTSYLGISGINEDRLNGVIFMDSYVKFLDITDGTSNTLMVGERPPSADAWFGRWYGGWGHWKSINVFLGVRETGVLISGKDYDNCSSGPYNFQPGSLQDPCSVFHYWSLHPGGANFAMADGSARFLTFDAAPLLPALASKAGGETVELPQ